MAGARVNNTDSRQSDCSDATASAEICSFADARNKRCAPEDWTSVYPK